MLFYTRTYCPACGRWFDGRNGASIPIATCPRCTADPDIMRSRDIDFRDREIKRDTRNREKVILAERAIRQQEV